MFSLYDFNLYLFDFDGVLVNTESLHFQAYRQACEAYDVPFDYDLHTYITLTTYDQNRLKKQLLHQPILNRIGWETFYQKKTECYTMIVEQQQVEWIPGAQAFLQHLADANKTTVIVTNSKHHQVEHIAQQHPLLRKSHWLTREKYQHPKPDPECYHTAIKLWGKAHERMIGFEDSFKGMQALLNTQAYTVFVSEFFNEKDWSFHLKKPDLYLRCFEALSS